MDRKKLGKRIKEGYPTREGRRYGTKDDKNAYERFSLISAQRIDGSKGTEFRTAEAGAITSF